MYKHQDKQRNEYERLCGENIRKDIIVGDRVVVAVGLIGRGFSWIRKTCEVIEVADTSCCIRHTGDDEFDNWEEWIDRFLIVDVLPKIEAQPQTETKND